MKPQKSHGFAGVGVRVGPETPQGYPCQSLYLTTFTSSGPQTPRMKGRFAQRLDPQRLAATHSAVTDETR